MQCPACAHPFEMFTPTQHPESRPRAGAPVICEQCLSLSIFAGTMMRRPTAAELKRYGTHLRRAIQYWITHERA